MDQDVKQMEEERGLPRLLVSIFIGILIVVALILVGGRIIQNRMSSDKEQTASATAIPTPTTSGGFPTIAPTQPSQVLNQEETMQVDQTKGGAGQLPATGSPIGLLGVAIFSASAVLGAFLRRKF